MKHKCNYSELVDVPEKKLPSDLFISKQLGVIDLLLWCSLYSVPLHPHTSVLL